MRTLMKGKAREGEREEERKDLKFFLYCKGLTLPEKQCSVI